MSYNLLDQLTGPLAKVVANYQGLTRNVKYGIKADVDINANGEFSHHYKRSGALFTNMLSPFGILKAQLIDDIPNFSGINVRFINDNGQIDERCIYDTLKQHSYYRPATVVAIAPLIASVANENHVSVLVNLLRVSRILKSNPADFVVKPDDLFYDDGHINISYRNYLKRDFNGWRGLTYNHSFFVNRFDENASIPTNVFCPHLENLTSREFNIFCTLISEINCDYPLRIAFSSPSLVDSLYVPFNSKHNVNYELVYDMTAMEVDVVLRKYVFANRVASDFDLAYLIVTNAMYAPLPRAAEAHGWISPINNIYLPKATSIRGFIPQLTTGSPYEPHPDRLLTWSNYANQPNRMMIHALATVEAFYTGLFEILTANPDGLEDSLSRMGITSYTTATPYKMYCEAVSYRFGKEFDLLWDTQAGVDCFSHLLATTPIQYDIIAQQVDNKIEGYEMYELKTGTEKTVHLVCRELKPAIFPVLSMGINDDRYFNNSLEYETTLYHNYATHDLTTVSSDDANKAMSIFRVGGYNATLIDTMSGRAMRNWAANSNGQVVPVLPPGIVGATTYKFPIRLLTKRSHCWMEIPNVIDKLHMTAKINIRGWVIMLNGKSVGGFMPTYKPITVYPKALGAEQMTVLPMKTDPTVLKYRYRGFTLAVSQENAPVVHLQSSPMDTADLQPAEDYQEPVGAPEEA
nr:MAG: capsid protein [Totiviridae sp.]